MAIRVRINGFGRIGRKSRAMPTFALARRTLDTSREIA
jgi:glyceraldehyde-3-phosphate dehydrogenase/erythrose-4-phosphate dehydrogenase